MKSRQQANQTPRGCDPSAKRVDGFFIGQQTPIVAHRRDQYLSAVSIDADRADRADRAIRIFDDRSRSKVDVALGKHAGSI
jgi:hypothetical protein